VTVTLAESLAAGDPEAFAALYDRLAARLLGAARTMTGSSTDAEDIVHDLFVALARGRRRLAAVADLEAYVFTMLRNAVWRRGRRQAIGRRAVRAVAEARRMAGGFATEAADLPDDALAAAVKALPDAQREVVALKIDAGLTFAEIAAVTGTSLNTAASRYRYALDKLRVVLAEPGERTDHPSRGPRT
jgi:RNA polymerase sigma-70 factor (ECF subfamily)